MITVYCARTKVSTLKGFARDFRPTWILEELGVKYIRETVDFDGRDNRGPAYLKIHPLGMVPALNDNGLILFGSAAIVNHIARKFGSTDWIPNDMSTVRSIYDQWAFFCLATIEPLSERVAWLRAFGSEEELERKLAEIGDRLRERLKVLDEHLKTNTSSFCSSRRSLSLIPVRFGSSFARSART